MPNFIDAFLDFLSCTSQNPLNQWVTIPPTPDCNFPSYQFWFDQNSFASLYPWGKNVWSLDLRSARRDPKGPLSNERYDIQSPWDTPPFKQALKLMEPFVVT